VGVCRNTLNGRTSPSIKYIFRFDARACHCVSPSIAAQIGFATEHESLADLHIFLKEIGKSAREIPISFAEIPISSRKIHKSAREIPVSLADLGSANSRSGSFCAPRGDFAFTLRNARCHFGRVGAAYAIKLSVFQCRFDFWWGA